MFWASWSTQTLSVILGARLWVNLLVVARCKLDFHIFNNSCNVDPLMQEDGRLCIFIELVRMGSLETILRKYKRFEDNTIRSYTRQILLGLEYLHAKKTMHRCFPHWICFWNSSVTISILWITQTYWALVKQGHQVCKHPGRCEWSSKAFGLWSGQGGEIPVCAWIHVRLEREWDE